MLLSASEFVPFNSQSRSPNVVKGNEGRGSLDTRLSWRGSLDEMSPNATQVVIDRLFFYLTMLEFFEAVIPFLRATQEALSAAQEALPQAPDPMSNNRGLSSAA